MHFCLRFSSGFEAIFRYFKGAFLGGGGGLHAPLLLAEDAAAVVLAVEAVLGT